MNAIVRLAFLYFSAFRWQRRLAIGGLVLFAAGLALWPLFPIVGPALALTGLSGVLLPAAANSGFLLRALSAGHSQRLVPGFRRRMLTAVGLVVAVEAVGVALGTQLLAERFSAAVLIEGLSLGALLGSMALIWTFAITGPPLQTVLVLTATSGVGAWAVQLGTASLPVSTPLSATAACALLWLLFGTWFRRVRVIAPVGVFQSMSLPAGLIGEKSAHSETAWPGLYLGDRLPWSLSRRLAILTVLAAAVAGVVWVLDRLDRRIEIPLSTLLNVPLIVTFLGLPRVYRMITRSHALWLRTPGLRAGVFRICETEALRDVAWNVVFAGILVSGFILVRPSLSWALLPWAVLLYLATGVLIAYLGLMLVHGLRATDLTAGLLLAALSLAVLKPLAMDPTHLLPVVAVVVIELVGALTLRSIACRRWTAIDWLRLRAPRARSQAVRVG